MDAPCGLIILITVPTRSGKHELEESIACETSLRFTEGTRKETAADQLEANRAENQAEP